MASARACRTCGKSNPDPSPDPDPDPDLHPEQDCHKSLKLLHLPPVLALQLKRFRHVGNMGGAPYPLTPTLTRIRTRYRTLGVGRKASDAVSFPLTGLDLTPYYAAACPARLEPQTSRAQLPATHTCEPRPGQARSDQKYEYELVAVVTHHGLPSAPNPGPEPKP